MSGKRLLTHRTLTSLFAICATLQPTVASYAQIAIDVNAPIAQRPVIDRAANGTQIVDIATPNAAGVSHNVYQTFNVPDNGAILNNSTVLYQSQIGGLILGNPRINVGSEARLIVNEVSGLDRSRLAGYLEVTGRQAAVVIANPNGITCDGCGFVNIPRATLTTGRPTFDDAGNLKSLYVTGGNILIEGGGLDASRVERLDLVTRAVEINAALHAKDFFLSGGRQSYDYTSGAGTAIDADGSTKPVFYLDSTALGGIYGDRIRIVGTEAGLGINAPQNLAASMADMELRADGKLILRNASASGNLSATSTQSDVEIVGTTYSDTAITIDAANVFKLDDQAVVGTKGLLTANARQFTLGAGVVAAGLNPDGTFAATGGSAVFTIADTANIASAGLLHGGDGIQFTVGGTFSNAGIVQGNGFIQIKAQNDFTNSGTLSTSSNIALDVAGIVTNGTAGTITSGQDLSITTPRTLNLGGLLQAGRDIHLNAATASTNNVSVTRNAFFSLGALQHRGTIAVGGGGTFSISGDALLESAAVIGAVDNLDFVAGNLDNSGTIATDGALTLSGGSPSASLFTNRASGTIAAGTSATVTFFDLDNNGQLSSNFGLTVNSQSLTNSDRIIAAENLTLNAALTVNSGTISAKVLSASIGNLTNDVDAYLQANDVLKIDSATLVNRGRIVSTGTGNFRVGALANDGGSILTQNALTIEGAGTNTSSLNLIDGQIASTGSDLTLRVADLSVSGTLASPGDILLYVDNDASLLSEGSIQAGRDVVLTSGRQIDAQSTIRANRNIELTAPTLQTFDLGAGQNIVLTGDRFTNSGTLAATNDVALSFSASVTNPLDKVIGAGRILTISTPLLNNDGAIAANGEVLLTGGTAETNAGAHTNSATGQISAAFVTSLDLGSLNNAGIIFASDLVNLSGGALINLREIGSDDAVVLDFSSLTNNGLVSGDVVALLAEDAITNSAVAVGATSSSGIIQAVDSLELIAPTIVNTELLASGGTLRVGAGSFTNTEGLVISKGDLTLDGLTAGTRANLIHNEAGTFESVEGNITIRADTLENFGDGIVQNRVTEIRHQYITGQNPPAGLAFYPDLISSAGYNQLYDGGLTAEYVWVPSPEQVQIILNAEGITIDQWTPTLWQKYAPNPSTFDPTLWAIYVPDEERHAPPGAYIAARDERDIIVKPNTPSQILTDQGNIFIDATLLHNRQSTISAVGDMVLTGGSVLNEGVTLNSAYTLTSSYNNGTLRGMGWSRFNGTGTTQWIPRDGGTILVRSASIGTINSTITATGTLSGNLAGTFANIGTPATDPDTLSFVRNVSGIFPIADPGPATVAPPATLNGASAGGSGVPSGPGGGVNTVAAISNSQLRAFAPAINDSRFVIETRLAFINLDDYFGSDYFFDRLGLTPDEEIKLLGDAYFDTTIIRAQILDLTGKRFLSASATSDAEQVKELLDNGVALSKRLNLAPGIGLTPEQQEQLTSNVVLYVATEFRGRQVLVPQLYLSRASQPLADGRSARVSARVTELASLIFVNDNGTITGTDGTIIQARDVFSQGGRFEGSKVSVDASGSIVASPIIRTTGNGTTRIGTVVGLRTEFAGDNIALRAPTIDLQGVQIKANENIDIAAKNLRITPAEAFARSAFFGDSGSGGANSATPVAISSKVGGTASPAAAPVENRSGNFYDDSRNLLLLSNLEAGGSINIRATDTAFIRAATIKAGDNVQIHAGTLFIGSGQEQSSSSGQFVKKGFTDSTSTWDYITVTQIPTIIDAGKAIQLSTTIGDTVISASLLKAGEINIQSAGQIRIESAFDSVRRSDTRTGSNVIIESSSDKGIDSQTARQTQLDASKVSLVADRGIVIQFRQTGDLDQSIADLSQFSGFAYLKDLKGQPGVDFQAVRDQYKSWDHSQWGLSGPAATLIALAVAAATGQVQFVGATLGGSSLAATAVNAGFSALVARAQQTLLTTGFDFGATLRDLGSAESIRGLATAVVTAGVLGGINEYDVLGTKAGGVASNPAIQRLREELAKAGVKATVSTAINGESFSKSFADSLKYAVVSEIGAAAANQIAESSPNSVVSLLAHTALGCAFGAASAGDCRSGAIGAAAGEAVALGYEQITASQLESELNALANVDGSFEEIGLAIDAKTAEWRARGVDISRLAAGIAALGTKADVNIAANSGRNSAENNALFLIPVALFALETVDKLLLIRDVNRLADTMEAYAAAVEAGDTERAESLKLDADSQKRELGINVAIDVVAVGGTIGVKKFVNWLKASGSAVKTGNSLAGIRTADGLLYNGVTGPGPLGTKIASTFRSGSYTEIITPNSTTLYRVYGGKAAEIGPYWTRTAPKGPFQSILDSALDPAWGNNATKIVRIDVPKGVKIYEGVAASQGGLVGGGNQVFIQNVDPSWIVR